MTLVSYVLVMLVIVHLVHALMPAKGVVDLRVFSDDRCTVPFTSLMMDYDQQYAAGDDCHPPTGKAAESGHWTLVSAICSMDRTTTQLNLDFYANPIGSFVINNYTSCPYTDIATGQSIRSQNIIFFDREEHTESSCVSGALWPFGIRSNTTVYGKFSCHAPEVNSAPSRHWSSLPLLSVAGGILATLRSTRVSMFIVLAVLVMMSSMYLPHANAQSVPVSNTSASAVVLCQYSQPQILGPWSGPNVFSDVDLVIPFDACVPIMQINYWLDTSVNFITYLQVDYMGVAGPGHGGANSREEGNAIISNDIVKLEIRRRTKGKYPGITMIKFSKSNGLPIIIGFEELVQEQLIIDIAPNQVISYVKGAAGGWIDAVGFALATPVLSEN